MISKEIVESIFSYASAAELMELGCDVFIITGERRIYYRLKDDKLQFNIQGTPMDWEYSMMNKEEREKCNWKLSV